MPISNTGEKMLIIKLLCTAQYLSPLRMCLSCFSNRWARGKVEER